MTLRQLCAFVYVVMVDLGESRAQSTFIAQVVAKSQGAEIEVITPNDARLEFEEWLRSAPDPMEERTTEERTLIEALFPKNGPIGR